MNIQNLKSAISARRNYDWLSLLQILSGFLLTALPNVLDGKILGYAVMFIGALQLTLKWIRTQQGLAGEDLPKDGVTK
jgi:hypothetical protein